MKHTPTPWVMAKTGVEPGKERIHVGPRDNLFITVHHSDQEWDEFEANAAFIVKACNNFEDLLMPLKI